jgi:integrase
MNAIESTLRHGSLRIDVRRYAKGRFGFDYAPPGEERKQVRLSSLEDAEAKARELLGAARAGKVERLAIDEQEYAEFLRWKAERGNGRATGDVVASFLRTKQGKGRSHHHTRRLEKDLESFAASFPVRLDAITREQIERWLDARKVGPRRWNNLREAVVSLYRFARREGTISEAVSAAERIDKRAVRVTVQTYTPEELRALLKVVPADWLPLIVLGAFAGLRPQEICPDTRPGCDKPPLLWENILWAKRKVDVPAAVAKDRRRRLVPLCDAALAFLEPYRKRTGPVVPRLDLHRLIPAWSKASGVPWRKDGLRHSYASYRLAVTKDMASLALEMGNSPSMIFRHYLDLKHEEEGAEWFAIRPGASPKSPKSPNQKARKSPV